MRPMTEVGGSEPLALSSSVVNVVLTASKLYLQRASACAYDSSVIQLYTSLYRDTVTDR